MSKVVDRRVETEAEGWRHLAEAIICGWTGAFTCPHAVGDAMLVRYGNHTQPFFSSHIWLDAEARCLAALWLAHEAEDAP